MPKKQNKEKKIRELDKEIRKTFREISDIGYELFDLSGVTWQEQEILEERFKDLHVKKNRLVRKFKRLTGEGKYDAL